LFIFLDSRLRGNDIIIMNELMTKLGIDWRLFIAQLVNFAVLIAVLYRFAYKPVLTLLEKRRVRIEKSLEEAARIEAESARMEQLKMQKVDDAKREAQQVLEDAAKKAEAVKQATLATTRVESEKIVLKAKAQIAHERGELLKGVQSEAAELVASAVEKVLKEKMDGEKDKKFIIDALQQFSVSNVREAAGIHGLARGGMSPREAGKRSL